MQYRKFEDQPKVLCPVCGEYTLQFTYDICPVCGWEHEEMQLENPRLKGYANKLSLIKYRKRFKKFRKKDIDYNWMNYNDRKPKMDEETAKQHSKDWKLVENMVCPVCGEYTFAYMTDRCNVCGWENNIDQYKDPDLKKGVNKLSLNKYRKRFIKLRHKNKNYNWNEEYIKKNPKLYKK